MSIPSLLQRHLRRLRVPTLVVLTATLGACAFLQQIAALRQVTFALAGFKNGRLAGVSLQRIASYQDLSAVEIGRLALALARNDFPLEF